MNDPILIDTSVWIDFFNGIETDSTKIFIDYLQNDLPIFVCPIIIQEILQGIKRDKEYKQVKDYLFALNMLNEDAIEAALGAVKILNFYEKNYCPFNFMHHYVSMQLCPGNIHEYWNRYS